MAGARIRRLWLIGQPAKPCRLVGGRVPEGSISYPSAGGEKAVGGRVSKRPISYPRRAPLARATN